MKILAHLTNLVNNNNGRLLLKDDLSVQITIVIINLLKHKYLLLK